MSNLDPATAAFPEPPKVRLRAIEADDLPQLRDWRNGLMEAGTVRQWRYLNQREQEAWWTRVSDGAEHIMLAVEAFINQDADGGLFAKDDWRLIGVVGLCYWDHVRQHAEASIYLGVPTLRGKGYGEAMLTALCDYGFGKLALHRIWAEIFAGNEASKRLFEKARFRHEGTLREHSFHDGKWRDSWIYGLLADGWWAHKALAAVAVSTYGEAAKP